MPDHGVLRDQELRPPLRQVIVRSVVVVIVNALALWLLEGLLDGLSFDSAEAVLLAGAVLGVLNALVWPAVAFLVVPLSVLTLGIGAIVVNAVMVGLVLDSLPGVEVNGFGTAVLVTLGLTVVTAFAARLLAIDDDAWLDERMARRARRRVDSTAVTDTPGVVFVQIDGLSEQVLRRALASGDVPNLRRLLATGSHRLVGWTTDWSSQTGVSQCGILHGSTDDMPAFRWVEKDTGTLMVSNRPESAAEIERRHSDGNGLLAHHGSSYGNLFTGDAERAVLTMSVAGRVKEGRIGAGYRNYFARPSNAVRTLVGALADLWRERRGARDQRRRQVEPRVHRSLVYSLLRAFTTVVSRDVCVFGVLGDMAEGRAAIYVDLLGYDEVSHHSGPERSDTLAVLRDIDRQVGRIVRAVSYAPRPYHVVVLSDHGQTQGPTFEDQFGESLEQLVERLTGQHAAVDPDSGAGKTESTAWFRSARGRDDRAAIEQSAPTVLGSGSLGLIYLPGPSRLTLEEIDDRHPGLVEGLRTHPGVGFVLVRSAEHGDVVLGGEGRRLLADAGASNDESNDAVEGRDPLEPYGPSAVASVTRVAGFGNVADLMVNATYDPQRDEIYAFEHQVGSHGGLGGPQIHPFLLHPVELSAPDVPIVGAADVYRVFKGWLHDLGHPGALEAAAGRPAR